ncbi:D-2-hydroxyacid dehydrogenase [Vibrio sp. SCSIO 43137]|uniref:D-2-hydroxyacid dehydrogenase n=1 Tax=Vibrio sp. SCSIO 43137 TaxID=3021011 RepID=UPI002307634B|nr:D-2-hydroxyacid dehydrogenase [Vibrio sp. SCSIO 43137]WCE31543.1 D-2-hydroxyacid dehydrogenase [Vibrio sp. SCSIO 43137]
MKKIVCLDGYTLNPGDNPWDAVARLGEFDCYDESKGGLNQVIKRAENANVLLTNKTPISREVIDRCEQLEYIGVLATGYNVVDYEYAREKGIPVVNVPAYGTDTVAEMVFAMMFNLVRKVEVISCDVRDNLGWSNSGDWTYTVFPQAELAGKTIGILGFGRIGQRVAELANAFKMKVVAYSPRGEKEVAFPVEFASLDELLKQSDIVSLHCPVFPDTENLFDKQRMLKMKPGSLLINTARGQLVVEQDLAELLNSGHIAGAALDTLQQEPPLPDNPLLSARNCVITPHVAWATLDARKRITQAVADNIEAWLKGKPVNIVNKL